MPPEQATIRLLISCPDQHGIVAAVSGFLSDRGANIVEADQHATAPKGGTFFMRMAFGIEDLEREPSRRAELARDFAATVAERFDMDWRWTGGSHTEQLDACPIIEQDVTRVSHRHGVADLTSLGQDIERVVLARAVRWHLEDRVLVHENRTVVF